MSSMENRLDKQLKEFFIDELYKQLHVLSSKAAIQISYLDGIGNVCVDELALDFQDLFLLSKPQLDSGVISKDLYEGLRQLDQTFDEMSGESNTHLWSVESLEESKVWEKIRVIAKSCLSAFPKSSILTK